MDYWKIKRDASKEIWEIERIVFEMYEKADAGGDINWEDGVELAVRVRDAMQQRIDALEKEIVLLKEGKK